MPRQSTSVIVSPLDTIDENLITSNFGNMTFNAEKEYGNINFSLNIDSLSITPTPNNPTTSNTVTTNGTPVFDATITALDVNETMPQVLWAAAPTGGTTNYFPTPTNGSVKARIRCYGPGGNGGANPGPTVVGGSGGGGGGGIYDDLIEVASTTDWANTSLFSAIENYFVINGNGFILEAGTAGTTNVGAGAYGGNGPSGPGGAGATSSQTTPGTSNSNGMTSGSGFIGTSSAFSGAGAGNLNTELPFIYNNISYSGLGDVQSTTTGAGGGGGGPFGLNAGSNVITVAGIGSGGNGGYYVSSSNQLNNGTGGPAGVVIFYYPPVSITTPTVNVTETTIPTVTVTSSTTLGSFLGSSHFKSSSPITIPYSFYPEITFPGDAFYAHYSDNLYTIIVKLSNNRITTYPFSSGLNMDIYVNSNILSQAITVYKPLIIRGKYNAYSI